MRDDLGGKAVASEMNRRDLGHGRRIPARSQQSR
jgi:hypothetical protein